MSVFRERDTLARLGGDEFGLLLENCPLEKACEIAADLVAAIRDYRFAWAGHTFEIGVNVGLVPITATVESLAQLLSQADVVCYTAKEGGRNRVHVGSPGSQGKAKPFSNKQLRYLSASTTTSSLAERRSLSP
jgi:diguanylate cyclase (GGDEF)-like protein